MGDSFGLDTNTVNVSQHVQSAFTSQHRRRDREKNTLVRKGEDGGEND